MKFEEQCELEPRLRVLFDEAQAVKSTGPTFCANAVWFGYDGRIGIKPRLVKLVGWTAENRQLATTEDYDIAYQTIYNCLPGCGPDCCCM